MSDEPSRLRIHVRRVVSGDGTLTSEPEVYCAPRDRSVSVSVCEACTDYTGSGVDLEAHRNYVLCRRLTTESARALRTGKHTYVRRQCHVNPSAAERTPVATIMRGEVVCVREELPLHHLAALFKERRISGAPVVNDAGEAIAVVSQADLIGAAEGARVRDVMTRLTFVVPDSASVAQAAALMALERIHRLPVISEDGKVVGILSSIDVMDWMARNAGYLLPEDR
jgi:CBS-domain-containing membrane protein